MKKALLIVSILCVAVISTACINNIAVQELNNKAAEYMQKGDYESAMNRLQASIDLDNTMYETYYNLGVAAIGANKYEIAIGALEDGIKIKPDFYDFYYSLGVAQIGLADDVYEKSETEEAATADSEKGEVDIQRNIAKMDKESIIELKKSAVENLKKYLENVPDAQERESVEEMIKQSEDFISNDGKVKKED